MPNGLDPVEQNRREIDSLLDSTSLDATQKTRLRSTLSNPQADAYKFWSSIGTLPRDKTSAANLLKIEQLMKYEGEPPLSPTAPETAKPPGVAEGFKVPNWFNLQPEYRNAPSAPPPMPKMMASHQQTGVTPPPTLTRVPGEPSIGPAPPGPVAGQLAPLIGRPGDRTILGRMIYGEEATPNAPDYGRGYNLPLVKPGEMVPDTKALGFPPAVNIPVQAVKGILTATGELTTPVGIAMLVGLPQSRVISGLLTADMVHGLIKESPEFLDAFQKGDYERAAFIAGQMGVTATMAGLAAARTLMRHGIAPPREVPPDIEQAAPTAATPPPEIVKPTETSNVVARNLEPLPGTAVPLSETIGPPEGPAVTAGELPEQFKPIDVPPTTSETPTLANISVPESHLNDKTVQAMAEAYRAGNPALLGRPIAVTRTPDGFRIVEGHHRAAAAKLAGIEPPIVVLTEEQIRDKSAPEVDALAHKVYLEQQLQSQPPTVEKPIPQTLTLSDGTKVAYKGVEDYGEHGQLHTFDVVSSPVPHWEDSTLAVPVGEDIPTTLESRLSDVTKQVEKAAAGQPPITRNPEPLPEAEVAAPPPSLETPIAEMPALSEVGITRNSEAAPVAQPAINGPALNSYVNSLKRGPKRDYAQAYVDYLMGKSKTEPKTPKDLSFMAGQAVRMNVFDLAKQPVTVAETKAPRKMIPVLESGPGILNHVEDLGGMRPRPKSGDYDTANYDGWDEAIRGEARFLQRNDGLAPDDMKESLNRMGYNFANTSEMYDAIRGAVDARKPEKAEISQRKNIEAQNKEFDLAAFANKGKSSKQKVDKAVPVAGLKVGDKFKIKGETLTIVDVHENGDVVADDGERYPRQLLEASEAIYPDKRSFKPAPEDESFEFKDEEAGPPPDISEQMSDADIESLVGPSGTVEAAPPVIEEAPYFHGTLVEHLEQGKLLPSKAAKDDLQAVFFSADKDDAKGYAVSYDPASDSYKRGQVIEAKINTDKILTVSAKDWKSGKYDSAGYDAVKIKKAEADDPSWLKAAFPNDTLAVLNSDVIEPIGAERLTAVPPAPTTIADFNLQAAEAQQAGKQQALDEMVSKGQIKSPRTMREVEGPLFGNAPLTEQEGLFGGERAPSQAEMVPVVEVEASQPPLEKFDISPLDPPVGDKLSVATVDSYRFPAKGDASPEAMKTWHDMAKSIATTIEKDVNGGDPELADLALLADNYLYLNDPKGAEGFAKYMRKKGIALISYDPKATIGDIAGELRKAIIEPVEQRAGQRQTMAYEKPMEVRFEHHFRQYDDHDLLLVDNTTADLLLSRKSIGGFVSPDYRRMIANNPPEKMEGTNAEKVLAFFRKNEDKPIIVMRLGKGFRQTAMTLRHERTHLAQSKIDPGTNLITEAQLQKKSSDAAKLYLSASVNLQFKGYPAYQILTEVPAWIADGEYAQLGLSKEQAVELYMHYLDSAVENHGPKALELAKQLAPSIRKPIEEAISGRKYTQEVPQDIPQAGEGSGKASAGEASGQPGQPEILSQRSSSEIDDAERARLSREGIIWRDYSKGNVADVYDILVPGSVASTRVSIDPSLDPVAEVQRIRQEMVAPEIAKAQADNPGLEITYKGTQDLGVQLGKPPGGPMVSHRFEVSVKGIQESLGLSLKPGQSLQDGLEKKILTAPRVQEALAKQALKDVKSMDPEGPPPDIRVGPGAQTVGLFREAPSNLEQLTAAVKATTFSKQDPATRISIAKKVIRKLTEQKDAVSQALATSRAVTAGLWDWYRRPAPYLSFERLLNEYLGARSKGAIRMYDFAQEVKGKPRLTREAMVNWLEANSDPAVLASRAAATTNDGLKLGYEAKLNPEEQRLVQNFRNYYDAQLDEAIEAGILDHGFLNYVNHIWEKEGIARIGENPAVARIQSEINAGLLKKNPALAKKRFWATYFDGEQYGRKSVNKDIGFLVSAYDQSLNEAIATRAFLKQLPEHFAADGKTPLAILSGSGQQLPKGGSTPERYLIRGKAQPANTFGVYKAIDHPALRGYKWAVNDADGNPILVEGDMLVHKSTYRHLNNVLSKSWLRTYTVQIGSVEFAPGRLLLEGSSFAKNTLLSLSPFHQFHLGVHAAEHVVSPLSPPKIDISGTTERSRDLVDLIDHGLMLIDTNAHELFGEGSSGVRAGALGLIPGLGELQQGYHEYLFKSYQPRLKADMALEALERNMDRYSTGGKKLDRDQILRLTSQQANAAFGGQNYKAMGSNPTWLDVERLILLAPDFLKSRFKFAGQALTPYGMEQRAALLRGALAMYGVARIANQVLDNDPHWDRPFSLVVGGREYSLRSIQTDMVHLFMDRRSFVYYRLNPTVTRTIAEAISGRDQYGRQRSFETQVVDLLRTHAPIPVQGPLWKESDHKLLDSLLQSVGIHSMKYHTAAEKYAREMVNQISSKEELSPENLERFRLEADLRDKLRISVEEGSKEVTAAVEQQKLSPLQAEHLLDTLHETDLERSTKRLPLDKAVDVYQKGSAQEKELLKPLLANKLDNFLNTADVVEQERIMKKLVKVFPELKDFKPKEPEEEETEPSAPPRIEQYAPPPELTQPSQ